MNETPSTLEPYVRRRKLERQINNLTADAFPAAHDRGEQLQKLRDLFETGVSYEYVMDLLRVQGYRRRTRKAMIEDAIGSMQLEDNRSEEVKQEARMLGKVKR